MIASPSSCGWCGEPAKAGELVFVTKAGWIHVSCTPKETEIVAAVAAYHELVEAIS